MWHQMAAGSAVPDMSASPVLLPRPQQVFPPLPLSGLLFPRWGKLSSNRCMSQTPDSEPDPADLTLLLRRGVQGDAESEGRFVALVYNEMRKMARKHMRSESLGHAGHGHGLRAPPSARRDDRRRAHREPGADPLHDARHLPRV